MIEKGEECVNDKSIFWKEAIIPTQSYSTDAGIDFYSLYDYKISPGVTAKVQTGICWKPQFPRNQNWNFYRKHFNIYMKIEDRSGLSSKEPLHIKAGVIDQSYRGEIVIVMQNHSRGKHTSVCIQKGQKIAQGIVYIVPKVLIAESDAISINDTEGRGLMDLEVQESNI